MTATRTSVPNLPASDLAEVVTKIIGGDYAAYRPLSTGDKSRVRSTLADDLRTAIGARDLATADAIMAAESALAEVVSSPRTRPTLDPESVLAARVADLIFAARLLASGTVAPSGLDTGDEVDSDLLRGVIESALTADLESFTESSVTVASAKITKSSADTDVAAHLRQVAAQHPAGTFLTVAQVAGTSTEECPDGYAHQGAIAARLFPASGRCTVSEVTPAREGGEPNGRRGMIVVTGAPEVTESDEVTE